MNTFKVWKGRSYPLGATVTPEGVNFALFSESATGVDLCLFDDPYSQAETLRIRMPEHTDMVWHCLFPACRPGSSTDTAFTGPTSRRRAIVSTTAKLLLDPYAKAIRG